jgi:hypothetical protein
LCFEIVFVVGLVISFLNNFCESYLFCLNYRKVVEYRSSASELTMNMLYEPEYLNTMRPSFCITIFESLYFDLCYFESLWSFLYCFIPQVYLSITRVVGFWLCPCFVLFKSNVICIFSVDKYITMSNVSLVHLTSWTPFAYCTTEFYGFQNNQSWDQVFPVPTH